MLSHIHTTCRVLLLIVLGSLGALAPAVGQVDRLAEAQGYLDGGQVEEALAVLDRLLKTDKKNAEALLLRSTGRIMNGDVQGGVVDLKKAIKMDPTLRQGWLNLAGLEIAQGRFEEAHRALLEAQKIDPTAHDNALNLGAVLLMQGKAKEAGPYFRRYLEQVRGSAEALYLVASNYALAGLPEPAVEHLRRAIQLDEHMRLRARGDERFLALRDPGYQELLATDSFTPTPDARKAAAAFEVPYNSENNRLVYAVLETLRKQKIPYNPNIEATTNWALVWADVRIKVSNQADGTGLVSISAPAEEFTPEEWQRRSQGFFRGIHTSLQQ